MQNTLGIDFIIRFLINISSLIVLVKYCYYRRTPNRAFLFSFFLFGTGVFIVSFLLRSVEVSMGFAFDLFAIFSMLRIFYVVGERELFVSDSANSILPFLKKTHAKEGRI